MAGWKSKVHPPAPVLRRDKKSKVPRSKVPAGTDAGAECRVSGAARNWGVAGNAPGPSTVLRSSGEYCTSFVTRKKLSEISQTMMVSPTKEFGGLRWRCQVHKNTALQFGPLLNWRMIRSDPNCPNANCPNYPNCPNCPAVGDSFAEGAGFEFEGVIERSETCRNR
ncbi:MAG: hypothetical protein C5B50_22220 [Verrucomicrobia bacterium]|nr:MAG: hypothetical protein C5B50_22220 [Verrucomicrobiota bacterium]